jgi:hypothetical protein
VKQKGKDWRCLCPAHDDHTPSLDVSEKNGRVMFICRSKGCSFYQIVTALGLEAKDCFSPEIEEPTKALSFAERIVKTYDYCDEEGKLEFQCVRLGFPKDFRQRRPDPKKPDGWSWDLHGCRRILYRLLEVLTADPAQPVFVCEGEKDVDRLISLGLVATTNPLGAAKWKLLEAVSTEQALASRRLVILADNDDAGRQHAADVAKRCDKFAASVTILDLPGLPPKGDVSDWLDQGGTVERLLALVAGQASPAGASPWSIRPANAAKPKAGYSAVDLLTREFPPAKYCLDGLLTEGLTVLAGKPKSGKSWLSLLISLAVAAGQTLDGRNTTAGEVLYLTLEDTERRLAGRLKKIAPGLGWPIAGNVDLRTSWPRADQGGLAFIADWIQQSKNPRLVIVDTLAKFRPAVKGNSNSYSEDYESLGGFKEMLDHFQISGLVVHHTRKLKAEDPFDEISGTAAISGAADSMWVLDSDRGTTGTLYVTGRDLGDSTIPLTRDLQTLRWTIGASVDGIDTMGRSSGGDGGKVSQKDQCCSWLRTYLAKYAYPSKEIDKAAAAAGFSFNTLKEAKVSMGRAGSGELVNHKNGQGEWWCGLGPMDKWKFRPEPRSGIDPDSDDSF